MYANEKQGDNGDVVSLNFFCAFYTIFGIT